MPSFLEELADEVIKQHGDELSSLTVVFPNRRAGLFFKYTLAKKLNRTALAPRVLTFEELACQLSDLLLADSLTLIYRLYEVFREYAGTEEHFDRFYFWGDILLKDFSEVDMALVNAQDIFTNLSDLKALEAGYDYLTDEQKQTIARFWKSFHPEGDIGTSGNAQQNFLSLWNKFLPVYQHFRQSLLEDGLAYEGLLYRTLAENADSYVKKAPDKLLLAGLNALKKAEEDIVVHLVKNYHARLFWDVDQHYLEHPVQEAGVFMRQYRQHPVLKAGFPDPTPDHYRQGDEREIQMHGVTLEVGQAKQVGVLLEELARRPDFEAEKVAIILPDEHLLFPLLHSLPEQISKVNVTMGYPLRNTSLYSFIEHLLNLQLEKKQEAGKYRYHHKYLLALLRHPYVCDYPQARALENIRALEQKNAVYVEADELLEENGFFNQLLLPVDSVPRLFEYLQAVSSLILKMIGQDEPPDDEAMSIPMLERELLYHFYLQMNRLQSLVEERHFDFRLPSFIRLLRQMFQALRVPFTGEPLRGLQVMGLLESRNLDFDYVFVLSANEGILPPPDHQNSFVPQNLKKGFGLFTTDQQDAFYAHAFFRLLHRSKKAFLFYNTQDTPRLRGEMSRFLYQLYYESYMDGEEVKRFPDAQGKLYIKHKDQLTKVNLLPPQPIVIHKNEQVLQKLARYQKGLSNKGRQARLTPSAINTYLDCRLKFYFRYVAKLREVDEVQEEVDAAVFGNILHKTMEELYQKFIRQKGSHKITVSDCKQLAGKPMEEAIKQGFREHYGKDQDKGLFEGRNAIAREIVRKMALRILKHDQDYAPFQVVSLEARGHEGFRMDLPVQIQGKTIQVALKGIIDRVDQKDGVIRVLDYKTGRDERRTKDITSLFDREDKQRNKAAMQALFYAMLYKHNQEDQSQQVMPGLINASELFKPDLDPRLLVGKVPMDDIVNYQEEALQKLKLLLHELFDPNQPFDQTDDQEKCSFCPYANICY